jgi:uncharacterized membrane protein YbjE (DUF340 family)
MSTSPTVTTRRLAGLSRQNIVLIVFIMIGAVVGMIAAYLFTSTTLRWLLAIACGLVLLAGSIAAFAYFAR